MVVELGVGESVTRDVHQAQPLVAHRPQNRKGWEMNQMAVEKMCEKEKPIDK